MEFNELEVFINAHGEITLKQQSSGVDIVRITADQAEIVAEEMKRLAKKIIEEKSVKKSARRK